MKIGYTIGGRIPLNWAKLGFVVKDGEQGTECWTNQYCQHTAVYYTESQVRSGTEEELKAIFDAQREKKNAAARKRRAIEAEKRAELKAREIERQKRVQRGKDILLSNPIVPCDNRSGIIVLDTETTGLHEQDDEMLQLSIIDGEGNTLLNAYLKPERATSWDGAMRINHITPTMVEDAPSVYDLLPVIQGIVESARTVVGYNIGFDLGFLSAVGIDVPYSEYEIIDVMEQFAEIYGEWSDYFENYKWQKLSTAAKYYHYEFNAHDSLADTQATLYIWKEIEKSEAEKRKGLLL